MKDEIDTFASVGEVISFKREYVCRQCRGQLSDTYDWHTRTSKVFCHRCGEGRGFTRRASARRREEKSRMDLTEAKYSLQGIFNEFKQRKTEEEASKALVNPGV